MRLSYGEMLASKEKIDKVNKRADKKGFTGKLEFTYVPVIVKKKNSLGIEYDVEMFDCEITGEPPKYGDWVFLARLDVTESGQIIPMNAPGVDKVDLDYANIDPKHCTHCNVNRYRKNVYLVRNSVTGEQQIVGSSCIKDFLGHSVWFSFFSEQEIKDDIEEGFRGGWSDPYFDTNEVLAVAIACTKTFGFVPTSSFDGKSTRSAVIAILKPYTKEDRELAAQILPMAQEASESVSKVHDFITSDEFSGDNDYVRNLKVLVNEPGIESRHLGLLVSAPNAYYRHITPKPVVEKEEKKESNWVGNVGEKITFTAEIVAITWLEDYYSGGSKPLYIFRDNDGNVYKWFASRDAFGEEKGVTVKAIATVKSHDEYKGVKQTNITRAKQI